MDLTCELFAARVQETFTVSSDDLSVTMVLVEAKQGRGRNAPAGVRSDPFSLYFKYAGDPYPPQGMYTFTNPALGELAIFVVPVGREQDGVIYEAIFN